MSTEQDAPMSAEQMGMAKGDNEFPVVDEALLRDKVRQGFSWSAANSLARRLWTFALGVALARMLIPADYGIFAIALAILTVLQTLSDLGVSVAIVRWQGDPHRPARTATTITLTVSALLYVMVFLAAPLIADALDKPDVMSVIRLLTFAVVFAGFSDIPNALLEREFLQKRLLVAGLTGIGANTVVSISLAVAGFGVWALTWGILAGNLTATVLIVVLAPARPIPGYRADDARALLKVGLPLSGASLLVYAMLYVDYLVIGALLTAEVLGLYLLAFNLSSWPPNLITRAVRSVSIPAFSKLAIAPARLFASFTRVLSIVVIVAFPISALLAVLARRVIGVIYGTQWVPAAEALVFLAALGAARVASGLCWDLLVALGRSRTVMWVQALWLGALIPAMYVGATWGGIRGAAIAHVVVAVGIMTPVFAVILRRIGVPMRPVAAALALPFGATAAMAVGVFALNDAMRHDLAALVAAVLAGIVAYGALILWSPQGRSAIADVRNTVRSPARS